VTDQSSETNAIERIFIAGGAGFIGSHFVERLLGKEQTKQITVYDNFSSGRDSSHLEASLGDKKDNRLTVIRGDIANLELLTDSMAGHDTVIHLASNPDIAKAATEPMIDFDQGTFLTQFVVEAMRRSKTRRILYASGSGVYGELGLLEAAEDYGPMVPISTYGASKLAGEALISAYAHMFGLNGVAFRFGNVVGPRQTHGVGLDFMRKLRANPDQLEILGDGTQSKSYVYIDDIVNAVLLAGDRATAPFDVFNVCTGDYITVKEIADIAIKKVLGDEAKVNFRFTGGDRGWKGDVPVVRMNNAKIRSLGWVCEHNCKQAIEKSLAAMIADRNLFDMAVG
jgi:UDP-glucose 4-epimerase